MHDPWSQQPVGQLLTLQLCVLPMHTRLLQTPFETEQLTQKSPS